MDITKLQSVIKENIGDLTFKEAFKRTNRVLNITVASTTEFEVPRLLNYLTSPNVVLWSAASASCALSGLYEPVELMAKDENGVIHPYHPSLLKWSDGSVAYDLPMSRLSELFNVNHFIVSQGIYDQQKMWLGRIDPIMISFLIYTSQPTRCSIRIFDKRCANSNLSDKNEKFCLF